MLQTVDTELSHLSDRTLNLHWLGPSKQTDMINAQKVLNHSIFSLIYHYIGAQMKEFNIQTFSKLLLLLQMEFPALPIAHPLFVAYFIHKTFSC
jgi:hypothetical protein